jgi:hypothetical protein
MQTLEEKTTPVEDDGEAPESRSFLTDYTDWTGDLDNETYADKVVAYYKQMPEFKSNPPTDTTNGS